SSGYNQIIFCKYIRIISNRVNLCFYYSMHKMQCVFGCSMNLRNAAEGIWILNCLSLLFGNFAVIKNFSDALRRFNLSTMLPHQMYQRIKGTHITIEGIQRYRTNYISQV